MIERWKLDAPVLSAEPVMDRACKVKGSDLLLSEFDRKSEPYPTLAAELKRQFGFTYVYTHPTEAWADDWMEAWIGNVRYLARYTEKLKRYFVQCDAVVDALRSGAKLLPTVNTLNERTIWFRDESTVQESK